MKMNKLVASLVAVSMLAGCGAPLSTPKKEYPTYGLFNESTSKSKDVCYEVSFGNVFWGVFLIETIALPIYFLGYSLYNPVRLKKDPTDTCGID